MTDIGNFYIRKPRPGRWIGTLSLSPIYNIRIEPEIGYEFGPLRRLALSLLFGVKWTRRSGTNEAPARSAE